MRIRFVTGHDFASLGIRVAEHDGWCTHVEAVMPDGTLLGAHFRGGVMARAADYDKGIATRQLIVSLDAAHDEEDKFNAFLRSQVGKSYDLTALAGFALGRDWHKADSWFCSELIAAALEESGYIPHLASINSHISPRDLLLVLSACTPIPNMAGDLL
jgi:hypothetical protein